MSIACDNSKKILKKIIAITRKLNKQHNTIITEQNTTHKSYHYSVTSFLFKYSLIE